MMLIGFSVVSGQETGRAGGADRALLAGGRLAHQRATGQVTHGSPAGLRRPARRRPGHPRLTGRPPPPPPPPARPPTAHRPFTSAHPSTRPDTHSSLTSSHRTSL